MRYFALACDYDGTIAHDGRVDEATLNALKRLLATGRHLVLVSGRELEDLSRTFAHPNLFEWLVLENGALLYRPSTREERALAPHPPESFLQELKARGVGPMSVGRVIVATWHPHETTVLKTIRDQGLDLQVIFNKGAVMILPAGVNKATGLQAALLEMGLSPHNVVGVGDAENDHAFLRQCECAVVVSNALPSLKEQADFTTASDHGRGVAELIDEIIADDLRSREELLTRHHLHLGQNDAGSAVTLRPARCHVLIAGPSGSGKSTVSAAILERLGEQKYQFCIIDPEGDYDGFEGAITLGSEQRGPTTNEVLQLLEKPDQNVVVNLIGMSITERPSFFVTLLPRVVELRARTGRPHWLFVDEAHHVVPASWEPGAQTFQKNLGGLALVTVHPEQINPTIAGLVDTVIAVGNDPDATLAQFAKAVGGAAPPVSGVKLETGQVLLWSRPEPPLRVTVQPAKAERHRHVRKYAAGELPPDRSFYFRGPEGKLNLRAQNLILFLQIADGVDDATWLHHLRQGDYSQWFEAAIKDTELAGQARTIEGERNLSAKGSRKKIKEAIERRYTLPAAPTLPMPGTDAK